MTDILLATTNNNKKREIKVLLKGFKRVKIINLKNIDATLPSVIENGKTFRQNAVKKAVTISKFFDGLVLADDSGVEVDALNGKPGVRSARFARAKATDLENLNKLLKLLDGVPVNRRGARFICHIALAKKGQLLGNFEGTVKGKITLKAAGKNGFGYDPVFVPEGKKRTFAELASSTKNRISHRASALNKFKFGLPVILRKI